MGNKFMTRKEVAALTGVQTTNTVRVWEKDGKLPVACKVNGRPRYSAADVKKLMQKGS